MAGALPEPAATPGDHRPPRCRQSWTPTEHGAEGREAHPEVVAAPRASTLARRNHRVTLGAKRGRLEGGDGASYGSTWRVRNDCPGPPAGHLASGSTLFLFQMKRRRSKLLPRSAPVRSRATRLRPHPTRGSPADRRRPWARKPAPQRRVSPPRLPAFKVLGAWWAAYRRLSPRLGREPVEWRTLDDLAAAVAPLRPLTLYTATDGSHGWAVARFARSMGFEALVFVPSFVAPPRIAAIRAEGARVEVVDGIFEDALHAAVAAASERCVLLSDDSWPGYTEVPGWVIDGYSTMFWEIDDQLAAAGRPDPKSCWSRWASGPQRRLPCGTTAGLKLGGRRLSSALSRCRPAACRSRLSPASRARCPAPPGSGGRCRPPS